jgi:hypothetical protein
MPSLTFMGITMPDADYVLVPVGRDGKYFAAVDVADWELVRWRRWSLQMSGECVYATTSTYKGSTSLHRFLMSESSADVIDHRDGCGLNCRRYNLREASYEQNGMNRAGSHDGVGVMGVTWIELRRLYKVTVGDELVGYYRDREEAVQARFKAAAVRYGEFARVQE